MTQEYWRWPESGWTSKDIDWRKAKTVTAGVDIGAVSSQSVVMCDGELYCYSNLRTSPDIKTNAQRVMDRALEGTGMTLKDIHSIIGTGWGRKNIPFSQKTVNEINCHAKGARFMFGPSVRTVFDMGGQTAKAIKLYEWDRISDFMVSDKCAGGMGRGIEAMADLMQISIEEIGERSLTVNKDPEPVSTTCYIFANTEALGLLRAGAAENEVLAAHLYAVASRLYTLIGRLNPEKELGLTGGLAKNPGIVKRLEKELGMTSLPAKYDPQLAGAIGAALLAGEQAKNSKA